MKIVKIGCCGFPLSRAKYYEEYSVVELQNTFYELPSIDWCLKLRSEAPGDFEFIVKAWQALTHPYTSPTWRKMKKKPMGNLENYGFLKPTRENLEAFSKVLEVANTLRSRIIVLQTPPTMVFNNETFNHVKEFFREACVLKPSSIQIAWEPRGDWARRTDMLGEIIEEHDIIHVTDILKNPPLSNEQGLLYSRLHGLNGDVNYKYRYSVEDLEKVKNVLKEMDFREAYVMFNNVYMKQDSKSLKTLLTGESLFVVK